MITPVTSSRFAQKPDHRGMLLCEVDSLSFGQSCPSLSSILPECVTPGRSGVCSYLKPLLLFRAHRRTLAVNASKATPSCRSMSTFQHGTALNQRSVCEGFLFSFFSVCACASLLSGVTTAVFGSFRAPSVIGAVQLNMRCQNIHQQNNKTHLPALH